MIGQAYAGGSLNQDQRILLLTILALLIVSGVCAIASRIAQAREHAAESASTDRDRPVAS